MERLQFAAYAAMGAGFMARAETHLQQFNTWGDWSEFFICLGWMAVAVFFMSVAYKIVRPTPQE